MQLKIQAAYSIDYGDYWRKRKVDKKTGQRISNRIIIIRNKFKICMLFRSLNI